MKYVHCDSWAAELARYRLERRPDLEPNSFTRVYGTHFVGPFGPEGAEYLVAVYRIQPVPDTLSAAKAEVLAQRRQLIISFDYHVEDLYARNKDR